MEDVAQQSVTAHFAISSQGALVYVPRDALAEAGQRTLVWVDRQGHEDPIKAPPRAYFYPRLSPDGTRVALEVRDQEGDIWIWDLARETLTRLTFGPTFEQYGVWTPDGRAVIFARANSGSERSTKPVPAAVGWDRNRRTVDAGRRRTVSIHGHARRHRADFSGADPSSNSEQHRNGSSCSCHCKGSAAPGHYFSLLNELNAEVSPDGRWLAYESNETGRNEIYVRPFPNVDAGKRQVSTNGGTQPLWARNGQELFYESGCVDARAGGDGSTFEAGAPRKLLDGPYFFPPGRWDACTTCRWTANGF